MKPIEFIENKNGCYICISHYRNEKGYPHITRKGKRYPIHRYIYIECFGEISDEIQVCHICDNPACINPEHLFLGTNLDNIVDRTKKLRCYNGKRKPFTKGEILEIKSRPYIHRKDLVKRFKCHSTTIDKIRRGINYGWLYPELNRN